MTYSPGDEIRFIASYDTVTPGADFTLTFTNQSSTVTSSTVTTPTVYAPQTIDLCNTNWTAAANVTCTKNTSQFKEGDGSQSIAIAAGFTTGKAAYRATGTLDLSMYEGISFWIRADATQLAGVYRVSLCSDTTGDTPVDDFDIDVGINNANRWYPITLFKGSALGSAIESVAFYCVSDPGTTTVLIDDIFAVTADGNIDCINLNTAFRRTGSNEPWMMPQSIAGNGTSCTIKIDVDPTAIASAPNRGYYGTTGTSQFHILKPLKTTIPTSGVTPVQRLNGVNGVTVSGGWNRTDMTTQTGETWIDGRVGSGYGLGVESTTNTISNIGCFRYFNGFDISGVSNTVTVLGSNHNASNGINIGAVTGMTLTVNQACANQTAGITNASTATSTVWGNLLNLHNNIGQGMISSTATYLNTGNITASNNGTAGLDLSSGGNFGNVTCNFNSAGTVAGTRITAKIPTTFLSYTASSNNPYGMTLSSCTAPVRLYAGSTGSNTTAAFNVSTSAHGGELYTYNFGIAESTKVANIPSNTDWRQYSNNEGNLVGNSIIRTDGGTIERQTTITDDGNPAYKVTISSTSIRTSVNPIKFSFDKVPYNAGTQVTYSARVLRNSSSAIVSKLVLPAGTVPGNYTDIVATSSAGDGVFETLSISFTPTIGYGVAEIFLYVYATSGTTNYAVIGGPLTITQA